MDSENIIQKRNNLHYFLNLILSMTALFSLTHLFIAAINVVSTYDIQYFMLLARAYMHVEQA